MRNSRSDIGVISLIFIGYFLYSLWAYRILLAVVVLGILTIIMLVFLAKMIMRLVFHTKNSRRTHSLEAVDKMNGVEFERCVATLLKQQGFTKISFTEKYDFGVDIIAVKDGVKWGIQVKRHSHIVKAIAVRQVVTALRQYGCDRAMVICNSYFSRIATELAKSNDCKLVDRAQLSGWLVA